MRTNINNRMVKKGEARTRRQATADEILGREFRRARHAELEPETAARAAARLAEEAMSHSSPSSHPSHPSQK